MFQSNDFYIRGVQFQRQPITIMVLKYENRQTGDFDANKVIVPNFLYTRILYEL